LIRGAEKLEVLRGIDVCAFKGLSLVVEVIIWLNEAWGINGIFGTNVGGREVETDFLV